MACGGQRPTLRRRGAKRSTCVKLREVRPANPAVAVGAVGTTRSQAVRTPALPCDRSGPSRAGTRGVSRAPKQPPRAPCRSPDLVGPARRRRSGCLRIADLSLRVSAREGRARPMPCLRSPAEDVEPRTPYASPGGRPTTARALLRMRQRTAVPVPHDGCLATTAGPSLRRRPHSPD